MKQIVVPARAESIPQVTDWADAALEALGCPLRAQMQIDVAIDEIVSNIARCAYPDGEGSLEARLDFDDAARAVSLTFLDSGVPFDPLQREDPDVTLPPEARGVGGLGIFLVKKTMDAVRYRYENGQNVLRIEKKI